MSLDKTQYIVCGFVRRLAKEDKMQIHPTDIYYVVLAYYNNPVTEQLVSKMVTNNGSNHQRMNNQHLIIAKQMAVKGIILISRDMTEEIIPSMINTAISGKQLYEYMDGSTYLQLFDQFNTGQLRIINYNFCDKQTNETLYCFVDRLNKTKGCQWKMRDNLFTSDEIEKYFSISNNKLPQSSQQKLSFINQLNHEEKIRALINKQTINWCKVPVFNKKSNTKRISLCLTKREFEKEINNDNNNSIIPIVMFDDDGGHHIEYVHIIKIRNNAVAISYKYDEQQNSIKPTAIHLTKEFIQKRHQLISLQHDCHCLNDLVFDVDYLQIGDPNKENVRLIYHKNRGEKLAKFTRKSVKYMVKMVSNPRNVTIENIQKWIETAKIVTTNDKVDITFDSPSLCSAERDPDNAALTESFYIRTLEEMQYFYFQQTLNTNKEPIIPHQLHQQIQLHPIYENKPTNV